MSIGHHDLGRPFVATRQRRAHAIAHLILGRSLATVGARNVFDEPVQPIPVGFMHHEARGRSADDEVKELAEVLAHLLASVPRRTRGLEHGVPGSGSKPAIDVNRLPDQHRRFIGA